MHISSHLLMCSNLCWLRKAPEMLKGDVVGPPADIWSIGILTYIMWVLSTAALSLKWNGVCFDFMLTFKCLVFYFMSVGAFVCCLLHFVFGFLKLSGACELSVAVIMFDMNAILVCNSKLFVMPYTIQA